MTPNVPDQMKAVAINEYGGPEKWTVQTLPVPEIGEEDVLVRLEVSGTGVWDLMEGEGKLIMGETYFPRILGAEGAGTVAAIGGRVTRVAVGDQVYAFGFQNPKGGCFAQYIVLPAEMVSPVPEKLSIEEAGGLPVDGITALCGLETLQLGAGQTLLVWGASGGVGHLAVQLAKSMGARVFAVASGADGVEFVQKLGAEDAVDGHSGDVLAKAKAFAPDGFDAALVLSGGDKAQAALEAVKDGGQVAFPHGVEPEPQPREGVKAQAFDGVPNPRRLEWLNKLIEAGEFEVHIDRSYPLEAAAQAQRELKEHFLGKRVVTIGGAS